MNLQNDLFLLMFTLSQMKEKGKIMRLFLESLNELFKPNKFFFSENNPEETLYYEEIIIGENSYGFLLCQEMPSKEIIRSIQNSVQMLALILDRLRMDKELKNKARSMESVAKQRLEAIKANVEELEDSKRESQTLIENLKKEISQREKIENELSISEEKFRLSFQTSPDAISINRLEDGTYIDINQGFTEISGYTADEIVGKTSYDIDMWVDYKVRDKLIQKVKKNGKFYNLQAQFRAKDGHIIEGLMSASLFKLNNVSHFINITRDISEIKKTQNELEKNEILFRKAFENSTSGMCLATQEGKFLRVNKKLCEILGYSSEELLGSSFPEITFPDDIPKGKENIKKALNRQIDFIEMEKRYIRKDGEIIWARVSSSLISDSEDNPLYFISHIIDITERKDVLEKIKLQRYHQQVILNAAPFYVWFKDTKNNFIRVNKTAAKLSHKTVEEVEGKSADIIFPEESQKYFKDDLEVINSGKPKTGIIETATANGKKFWVRTDKIPWYDENGEIAGVVVFALDISELKKAEETIKKERNQAQKYLDVAGVMLASLNTKGEIVVINKKGCEILGYDTAEELVGKNWLDLCLPKKNREEVKKVFTEHLSGNGKAFEYYENAIVIKSGEERIIGFNNTILIDENGKTTGVLFSGEDITERVNAEKEIKELNSDLEKRVEERTAELAKANIELGELNDVFVGREMRIIELKEEVARLKNKLKEK